MSYEVESIAPTSTSGVPNQSPPIMRSEERVINPYEVRQRPAPKTEPVIGQADIGQKAIAPEETGTTEETVKLSPQVAALARREQRFRQQQQQLEKDRAAIAAEKAEVAELKAMKEKLAAKDYSALDGQIDYNEWSQYQVNKINGTDPVQEELRKLAGKFDELEKTTKDNVSKQFEMAVNERRIATKELVEKSSQFPRVKKAGAPAQDAIVQHILDTWEHDSKELSIEDAAKEVEEILTEKAQAWKALLEDEPSEAPPTEEKKPLPALKPGLKTLTNQVTSSDLKRTLKPLHLMSEGERYAEARRRAEEKLQKGQR